MKEKKLRVAGIQQNCGDDHTSNLAYTEAQIKQAAEQGAKLIVLQELHKGVYFCQNEDHAFFDWAESIPGPTTDRLATLAKQLKVVIVSSIFERRAPGIYHNTAVVLDSDGTIAGIYRKMHIPDDPGFYEKFYFTPGDLGFMPIETSIGKLGVLVCWDQWYPEAARLMALAGADMLIYPTAIGWVAEEEEAENKRQRDAWITIQRSHAVANGMPVISINRTGYEENPRFPGKGLNFWGSSFICGPQGEFLAEASVDKPEILMADLDLARTEKVRRYWPFFRDRRIDEFDGLLERFLD
jgi:N-carbamoylputrescine amidase